MAPSFPWLLAAASARAHQCGGVAFTKHVISASADYAFSCFAIDVDDDGSVDVLSASMWVRALC